MKVSDIVNKYGLDAQTFEWWLKHQEYGYKRGKLSGVYEIDKSLNVDNVVNAFRQYEAQIAPVVAQQQVDANLRQAELAKMLITSGFSFDGYTITKYSGYISGDDVVQIDRGSERWFSRATDVGVALMESLTTIRRNALAELKEAALDLGCNAVIGVDFDYLTLDPETVNANGGTLYMPYVFGVTANGNAVIIERNDSTGLST